MGVNICHFIHGAIQTPLLGDQLRADCLYDCSQASKDVNVKQRHVRDQVKVFVHRIQHDDVEIVSEIPEQCLSCRGSMGETRSDSRPEPDEYNENGV